MRPPRSSKRDGRANAAPDLPRPPPLPSSLSNTTCRRQQIAAASPLAQRIPSSGSESASFAFILAKEDFGNEDLKTTGPDRKPMSRKELASDPDFKPIFDAAKERVRKMRIRAVDVQDPVEQTIFEVYAHLQLGTPHNSFENH